MTEIKAPKSVIPHSSFRIPHSRKGFTLLEVLVALAILSVITAALYSTFFLAHRAVEAVDDSLVRLQEARAAIDVLKRELEAAFYSSDKEYTIFRLEDKDFYGKQASQLVFTAFTPLMPGLSRISYTAEENKSGLVLRKKIASALVVQDKVPKIEFLENMEAFTVEARYKGKWVRTWDSTLNYSMPEEIRIIVKIRTKKSAEQEQAALFSVSDIARPKAGRSI